MAVFLSNATVLAKNVATVLLNIYNILPAAQALFGQRHIVRSIDILQKREYTYTYEEGKIVRAAEHTIELDAGGFITSRTFENSIIYVYDREGNLIKKKETPKEGCTRSILKTVIRYGRID